MNTPEGGKGADALRTVQGALRTGVGPFEIEEFIKRVANEMFEESPVTGLTGAFGAPDFSEPPKTCSIDRVVDEVPAGIREVVKEGACSAAWLKDIMSGSPASSVERTDPPEDNGHSFYFLPAPVQTAEALEPDAHKGAFDVVSVRKDFPLLNQEVNNKPLIWLDNAATTQKPRCVIDKLVQFYENDNSNIHRGAHTLARRATDAYEEARKKVQEFLGAKSAEEIVFVRGTTEAINLVAQSYGRKHVSEGDEIVLSNLEHHSNIVPWHLLSKEKGAVLRVIPINDDGEVMVEEFAKLLSQRTRLVAISHVSNVLGTVAPIRQIVDMAHAQGVPVLVDGAQAVPHLQVDVQKLDCDFYLFSGHKLFGPTGIGVLYGKKRLLDDMPPWQGGGNMINNVTFAKSTFNRVPMIFEAGTANIADAVGLGEALDYIKRIGHARIASYEREIMTYATKALAKIPGLRQFGTTRDKVGPLAFTIPGIRPEDLSGFLDTEGIAVRAGHHCAQPTMARYGVTSMVRPSIAFYNTKAEIDALAEAIEKARKVLKS